MNCAQRKAVQSSIEKSGQFVKYFYAQKTHKNGRTDVVTYCFIISGNCETIRVGKTRKSRKDIHKKEIGRAISLYRATVCKEIPVSSIQSLGMDARAELALVETINHIRLTAQTISFNSNRSSVGTLINNA